MKLKLLLASTLLSLSAKAQVATDPNCLLPNSQGGCDECANYYFFNGAYCIPVTPNCAQYDVYTGNCSTCVPGFTLTKGQCARVNPTVGTVTDSNCLQSGPQGCAKCSFRYIPKGGVCVPVNPHCKTWNPTTGQCLTCFGNLSLQNGQCAMSIAPPSSTTTAVSAPTQTSLTFSDPNCDKSLNGVCVKCQNRYFSKNGVCTLVNPQCKEYSDTTGDCTVCYAGYQPQTGKCVRPAGTADPYCIQSDKGRCQKCTIRYFVDTDGYCSLVSPYCLEYNQANGQCTTCVAGYDLVNGSCVIPGSVQALQALQTQQSQQYQQTQQTQYTQVISNSQEPRVYVDSRTQAQNGQEPPKLVLTVGNDYGTQVQQQVQWQQKTMEWQQKQAESQQIAQQQQQDQINARGPITASVPQQQSQPTQTQTQTSAQTQIQTQIHTQPQTQTQTQLQSQFQVQTQTQALLDPQAVWVPVFSQHQGDWKQNIPAYNEQRAAPVIINPPRARDQTFNSSLQSTTQNVPESVSTRPRGSNNSGNVQPPQVTVPPPRPQITITQAPLQVPPPPQRVTQVPVTVPVSDSLSSYQAMPYQIPQDIMVDASFFPSADNTDTGTSTQNNQWVQSNTNSQQGTQTFSQQAWQAQYRSDVQSSVYDATLDSNCRKATPNGCGECYPGFVARPGQPCVQANQNCRTYTPQGLCINCYPGYEVVNGDCVASLKIGGKQDPNCRRNDLATGRCLECANRFYMQNGRCVEVSPLCNDYEKVTGGCKSCFKGFQLVGDACREPTRRP